MDGLAQKAMDSALKLLSFRARSESELSDRLGQKGFSPEVLASVLVRLRELGLVNDKNLAQDLVDIQRRSGRGDHRIRHELKKRGLSSNEVTRVMAETSQPENDRAWDCLQKRASRVKGLDRDRAYRRLHGYLIRQGFGIDETSRALRRFFSGEPEEGAEP
ncbi:MAG: regulatory protein RecX [Elusimicrobia bacterium]|nr:regulatory protein RecX [Elusimicrobiota bacterium]